MGRSVGGSATIDANGLLLPWLAFLDLSFDPAAVYTEAGMKCTACGAQLGPTVVTCTYCGATTPFGIQHQQVHHHHAAHAHAVRLQAERDAAERKQQDAARSLKRTSDAAMFWGIGGLVLCCLLVPGAIAVVLGLRARKMGHKYDLVIPTSATLGLVLGLLGVLCGASFIAFTVVRGLQRDSEIAEIEQRLSGRLEQPALAHDQACLLAKRSLLLGEYHNSDNVDLFDCDGKLTVQGEQATLDDVRFRLSSTRHTVRVCFERGARWRVTGFRDGDRSCSQTPSVATASSSAGPRATPN